MKVSDAISSRITTRAFLDRPVPVAVLRQILETAKRAPSGGNLQPWHVWVLGGEEMVRFKAIIKEKMAVSPRGEGTEYNIYPPELKEPYKARRFKCGEDMYASINVTREDKFGRLLNFARNFEFFGAPVAFFFAIDRQMQQGQWADLGMFMQSIMLLAREHGLHTCPQEAWAIWYKTLGEFLPIPPELMLFCGMGIGYMDEAHPINKLRTDRAPLEEFVTFKGI
ncbi:MAG: nitroreductase [Alphaproteobacteria bacterium]|nr:nitroreductase [Alphaproteobacteria bacterium]